jgi:hypothetical protein
MRHRPNWRDWQGQLHHITACNRGRENTRTSHWNPDC